MIFVPVFPNRRKRRNVFFDVCNHERYCKHQRKRRNVFFDVCNNVRDSKKNAKNRKNFEKTA